MTEINHWEYYTNQLIQMIVSHHSGISHCRRQQRIVVPALFEAATSGNFAHAAEVLEEGDDLDAKVICLISTPFNSSLYICHVLVPICNVHVPGVLCV